MSDGAMNDPRELRWFDRGSTVRLFSSGARADDLDHPPASPRLRRRYLQMGAVPGFEFTAPTGIAIRHSDDDGSSSE